jgi:hypothetical protein
MLAQTAPRSVSSYEMAKIPRKTLQSRRIALEITSTGLFCTRCDSDDDGDDYDDNGEF